MRNWLYRVLIHPVTLEYYRNCLGYFPADSRILDVGIGNGLMIERFHELIRAKRLRITGLDIDGAYLRHCRQFIHRYGLEDCIEVQELGVENYQPSSAQRFDFVLFSMSFMLLTDPQPALHRACQWLAPHGEVVFAQAMYRQRSRFMDIVKPKLKYVTTVDFGRVMYERDFFTLLGESDLSVREDHVVGSELFQGQCHVIIACVQRGERPTPATATSRSAKVAGAPGRRFPRRHEASLSSTGAQVENPWVADSGCVKHEALVPAGPAVDRSTCGP